MGNIGETLQTYYELPHCHYDLFIYLLSIYLTLAIEIYN